MVTLNHFEQVKRLTQTEVRELKNKWWITRCEKLQRYGDYYKDVELKALIVNRILSAIGNRNGTMSRSNKDISNRWRLYYEELLNRNTTID